MISVAIIALAFACGGFIGFIVATFISVGKRADDEFDGGFRANNPPREKRLRIVDDLDD